MVSRYDPTPEPITCILRVFRDEIWYEQHQLPYYTVGKCRKIIKRMRRMGKIVSVTWLTGMGC